MTETTIRLGAGTLVRPEEEEARRCWVGKGLDGERCERPSAMRVYGLPMCVEHGEEAEAGALEEIYVAAANDLERPLNPQVRAINPSTEAMLLEAQRELSVACSNAERDTDELLLRAFPLDGARVDPDTVAEIGDPEGWSGYERPYDHYRRHREIVHRLMREAFQEDYTVVVEMLEAEREEVASQAAYAVALDRRNRPQPE